MNYKKYLELVTQLQASGVAQLHFGDHVLDISLCNEGKRCEIVTQICTCLGPIPPFIADILSTRGCFKWTTENISLKMSDEGHIQLIQEIEPVLKFIYLRSVIRDFLHESYVWKNFFHVHAAKTNYLYSCG